MPPARGKGRALSRPPGNAGAPPQIGDLEVFPPLKASIPPSSSLKRSSEGPAVPRHHVPTQYAHAHLESQPVQYEQCQMQHSPDVTLIQFIRPSALTPYHRTPSIGHHPATGPSHVLETIHEEAESEQQSPHEQPQRSRSERAATSGPSRPLQKRAYPHPQPRPLPPAPPPSPQPYHTRHSSWLPRSSRSNAHPAPYHDKRPTYGESSSSAAGASRSPATPASISWIFTPIGPRMPISSAPSPIARPNQPASSLPSYPAWIHHCGTPSASPFSIYYIPHPVEPIFLYARENWLMRRRIAMGGKTGVIIKRPTRAFVMPYHKVDAHPSRLHYMRIELMRQYITGLFREILRRLYDYGTPFSTLRPGRGKSSWTLHEMATFARFCSSIGVGDNGYVNELLGFHLSTFKLKTIHLLYRQIAFTPAISEAEEEEPEVDHTGAADAAPIGPAETGEGTRRPGQEVLRENMAEQKKTEAVEQAEPEMTEEKETEGVEQEKMEAVAEQKKLEVAEQEEMDMAEQKNMETAEQNNTEVAGPSKTGVAEDPEIAMAEQRKTEVAEQNMEVAEQKQLELAEQKVMEVAEQNKVELAEQKKTEVAEQKMEVARQRKTEPADQKKTDKAKQKKTEAAEQKKTDEAKQNKTDLVELKMESVGQKKSEPIEQKKTDLVIKHKKTEPAEQRKVAQATTEQQGSDGLQGSDSLGVPAAADISARTHPATPPPDVNQWKTPDLQRHLPLQQKNGNRQENVGAAPTSNGSQPSEGPRPKTKNKGHRLAKHKRNRNGLASAERTETVGEMSA